MSSCGCDGSLNRFTMTSWFGGFGMTGWSGCGCGGNTLGARAACSHCAPSVNNCVPFPFLPPLAPTVTQPAFGLSFAVIDEQGHALMGAEFALLDPATQQVRYTAVSNLQGVATFNNITPGRYTLVQTLPAGGFAPVEESFTVVMGPGGYADVDGLPASQFRFPASMPATRFQLKFMKTDNQSAGLGGATFGLRNLQNVDVATAVSDGAGLVTFNNLPSGTYTLYEQSAPAGYTPSARTFPVEVDATGAVHIYGLRPAGAGIGVGIQDSSVVNTPIDPGLTEQSARLRASR